MSALTTESTLMGRITPVVDTGAADDRSLTTSTQGWNAIIDTLLHWWENPAWAGDDEGFVPPTPNAIHVALQVARIWRDDRFVAPLRVVADGEGGVAFERRNGALFESLRVSPHGDAEILSFENARLVTRSRI